MEVFACLHSKIGQQSACHNVGLTIPLSALCDTNIIGIGKEVRLPEPPLDLALAAIVALTARAPSHIQFAWHNLIHITPDPPLAWLNRANEWMTKLLKMLGSMLVLGIVTTADMPTDQAQS